MLILTRSENQSIILYNEQKILGTILIYGTYTRGNNTFTRIGFDCDSDIKISRAEIYGVFERKNKT